MKFVCLGYGSEEAWDALDENKRNALVEECFVYAEELHKNGHWLDGGQALLDARLTKSLRWKDGKVMVTDGPFAETKEQLAGIGIMEARDMAQAVELMSKHSSLRFGPLEIRPINEDAQRHRMQARGERGSGNADASDSATKSVNFACLGYIDEKQGSVKPPNEFACMMEDVHRFDEALQKNGNWISGIALQGVGTAKTLRCAGDKTIVTDGPYAETKEHLGGVVVNRFRDMQQAVEVLSTHPALRFGVVIEIRPIDEETNAYWKARVETLNRV